jgi:hypothetical protein
MNADYLSPTEEQILLDGFQKYFGCPELGPARSSVCQELSGKLKQLPRTWNPREVRVWFNNSKHLYARDLRGHELSENAIPGSDAGGMPQPMHRALYPVEHPQLDRHPERVLGGEDSDLSAILTNYN